TDPPVGEHPRRSGAQGQNAAPPAPFGQGGIGTRATAQAIAAGGDARRLRGSRPVTRQDQESRKSITTPKASRGHEMAFSRMGKQGTTNRSFVSPRRTEFGASSYLECGWVKWFNVNAARSRPRFT